MFIDKVQKIVQSNSVYVIIVSTPMIVICFFHKFEIYVTLKSSKILFTDVVFCISFARLWLVNIDYFSHCSGTTGSKPWCYWSHYHW